MNLRIALSICLKNCVGILIGIALDLLIAFGKMTIFTMLILPIHEHGRSLHFLREDFFNFFLQRVGFLVIEIFYLFGYSHLKIFYIICDCCEGCYLSNFNMQAWEVGGGRNL